MDHGRHLKRVKTQEGLSFFQLCLTRESLWYLHLKIWDKILIMIYHLLLFFPFYLHFKGHSPQIKSFFYIHPIVVSFFPDPHSQNMVILNTYFSACFLLVLFKSHLRFLVFSPQLESMAPDFNSIKELLPLHWTFMFGFYFTICLQMLEGRVDESHSFLYL